MTGVAASSALSLPHVSGRRLAGHFITLSGGEGLAKVASFLAFAYLARTLGPTYFGYVEFALSIVMVLAVVIDCGLSTYSAREVATQPQLAPRISANVVLIHYVMAALCYGALVAFVLLIDRSWPVKPLLLLYGLSVFALGTLIPGVFQGRGLMQQVALASIARWLLFAAGVGLLVHGPDAILTLPLIELAAVGAAGVVYVVAGRRTLGPWPPAIDARFALSMLRHAWPIGASELVWAARMYSATIWLGLVATGWEVGLFGATLRLVLSLHTFVWLYFCSLLPALVRRSQQGDAGLASLLQGSLQVTGWLGALVCLVGTVFAPPLISLVYGPRFSDAGPAFAMLVWLLLVALMSGHYRYTLIARGRQRLELLCAVSGAAVCVALNAVLIPAWGMFGAVGALLTSEAVIWALAYVFVRRVVGDVRFWECVRLPLLTGGGLALAFYVLPWAGSWIGAAATVSLYLLVLIGARPDLLREVRRMMVRGAG